MKKLLVVLLFPFLMTAQKKEEVNRKLAETTCDCVSAKGKQKVTEMDLGLCILSSLNKLSDKEKKVIGYNTKDKAGSIEKIAEDVGMEMATICPNLFIDMFENNPELLSDEDEVVAVEEDTMKEEVVDSSTKGTFEMFAGTEFNTVVLTDEAGNRREFIWLFPFEGDSLFIKGKIVKGDKIEVYYREQSFFDPVKKEYRIYNEITEVNLL